MASNAPAMVKMSWLFLLLVVLLNTVGEGRSGLVLARKNAYATMLYMGTPRDHDFYIAARVMLRSLARLQVDADLVVIASKDLPEKWVQTLQNEGVKVVSVDDIPNPYRLQPDFDRRFLLTLNKLYAWNLVEYERVVMLDADNLFLQKTDELFQCGKFCAVFINPCIFHTGLFVLEPSKETFNTMLNQIGSLQNKDGADQGYLMAYFDDLLERPLFRPQVNGSRLDGTYRLPLGYQMDASYYYLKLRWSVPCGPNSVITFPSMPWLKPWYWWSWPVLPLGLSWHQQRVRTIGYEYEIIVVTIEALFYIAAMVAAYLELRRCSQHLEKVQPACKTCLGGGLLTEQFVYPLMTRVSVILAIAGSFAVPFFLVPRTTHPLMGWGLFLLGSFSLLTVNIVFFRLPRLAVFTPWLGILATLLVMAYPFYSNGIVRALSLGTYVFLVSPFLWWAFKQVNASIDISAERDSARPRAATRMEPQQSELMKLC